jgi:alpha-glucan,water dikinase
LLQFGIPANQFDQAWSTIKRTWASKFNERAFLSTRKLGIRIDQIFMAVLVQKIIPAEHAYVIHTTNPTNLEDDEVYVEACKGLGEALVSDMPGQALSFSYDKRSKNATLGHYPNKPLGLNSTGFIFRSDSNSEDLPGFAGAGLFDSYPMNDTNQFRIAYHSSRIFKDASFLNGFMKRLGEIGVHIEQIYDDDAQDIEGCFYNNQFYVV